MEMCKKIHLQLRNGGYSEEDIAKAFLAVYTHAIISLLLKIQNRTNKKNWEVKHTTSHF